MENQGSIDFCLRRNLFGPSREICRVILDKGLLDERPRHAHVHIRVEKFVYP